MARLKILLLSLATIGNAVAEIDPRQQTTLVTSRSSTSTSPTSTSQSLASRTLTSLTSGSQVSSTQGSTDQMSITEAPASTSPTSGSSTSEISLSISSTSLTSAGSSAITTSIYSETSTSRTSTDQPTSSVATSIQPSVSQAAISDKVVARANTLATPTLSFDEAIAKGKDIISKMLLDPTKATDLQSKWTDAAELTKDGWTKVDEGETSGDASYYKGVADFVAVEEGCDNAENDCSKGFKLEKNVWKQVGQTLRYMFDPSFNLIFFNSTNQPDSFDEDVSSSGTAPTSWSDITYLAWLNHIDTILAKRSRPHNVTDTQYLQGLTFIGVDSPTASIIEHIYKTLDSPTDGKFPGVVGMPGTDRHNALMGTPAGQHTGMLLAQHKEQLGNKAVDKIAAFCEECNLSQPGMEGSTWWLMFEVSTVDFVEQETHPDVDPSMPPGMGMDPHEPQVPHDNGHNR